MDSITQGLLGGAIAEAGFRRKLGGRAVVWGAAVAMAPDLDLVAALGGEWSSLVHHRGVSHSWLVETAVAPLLGWLAWRWVGKREGSWWSWAHLTWWALVTHPALDVCTVYGTQLFAPLTDHRFAIDAVYIIDPLYSLPLLVACVMARRSTHRQRSQRVAIGALLLSTAYLAAGWLTSQRAVTNARAELRAEGFEPADVRALPTLSNIIVHRLVARDDEGHFRLGLHGPGVATPRPWTALEDDPDPLVRTARETERGRQLRWFSNGYALFTRRGQTVDVADLRYARYADPRRSFMGAELRFDAEDQLVEAHRTRDVEDLDWRAELSRLADAF